MWSPKISHSSTYRYPSLLAVKKKRPVERLENLEGKSHIYPHMVKFAFNLCAIYSPEDFTNFLNQGRGNYIFKKKKENKSNYIHGKAESHRILDPRHELYVSWGGEEGAFSSELDNIEIFANWK